MEARTRRRLIVLGGVVGVVTAGLGLRAALAPRQELDYFEVKRASVRELVSAVTQGTVTTQRRVAVPILVSSPVKSLPVAEGALVKKDELIAELDDRDARLMAAARRAQRDAARAQAALARTQVQNARRELERGQSLQAQGAVSSAQLDLLRDTLGAAQEQLGLSEANERAAQAALEQAELTLSRHRIVAPFDGVLARLELIAGELPGSGAGAALALPGAALPVAASRSSPIEVLDPRDLYVEAQVDERDLGKIRLEQPVELTFDALGGKTVEGRVRYIRPLVEVMGDKSRQVTVRVYPSAEDAASLRVGMGADVEIVVEERHGVLALPPQLLKQKSGAFETVIYEDGTGKARTIEVGLSSWHASEVKAGLAEGDKVLWPPEEGEIALGGPVALKKARDTLRPAEVSAQLAP